MVLDAPAVIVDGERRPVMRPREQAVLTRLALAAPNPVPVDTLILDVWGDGAPPRALDALRVHVSNLRKLLTTASGAGSSVLRTVAGGYQLDLPEDAIDARRLERGAVSALSNGATGGAWSDHDIGRYDAGSGFYLAAARRVEDLRLAQAERAARHLIDTDEVAAAADVLERALQRAPYHERLWELLVLALGRGDRRADALRAFQRAREVLSEVGIEPGAALRAAEAEVLAGSEPKQGSGTLTSDYVDVDGSRIAFATLGDGPFDLLFMHGGFVPFEVMREPPELDRFIMALAERARVVFIDRRGIGMSDEPADGSPVTLDHWVSDARAVIDALGSRAVIAFGHEHAGPVAIRLAAEVPDRVKGLVLHSTAARPLRGPDHPYGPSEEVLERLDRMIDRAPSQRDMVKVVAPSAGDADRLRAWLDRAGRLGAGPARARQLHRTYLYSDVRHLLPSIAVPTVVLHPARMIGTDPGQARYLAEHLVDAELHLLDSGDHLFWLADAEVVLSALDRLLDRIRSATSRNARLRAIVAVSDESLVDVLRRHGAETVVTVSGAGVATFRSLAAARAALDAIAATDPQATASLTAEDTTGAADDTAIRAAVEELRSGVRRRL